MRAICVLDASVALKWAFESSDPYAERVLARLHQAPALVPSLWWLEVSNALLVAERTGRSTPNRVARTFAALHDLRLLTEPTASNVTAAALVHQLARRLGLSAYDAAYLELAVRLDLPLATLDGQLQHAAQAEGVALFDPQTAG